MILEFQRAGESLSDAGFRRRVERYYEYLRRGLSQDEALRRALEELDARGIERRNHGSIAA